MRRHWDGGAWFAVGKPAGLPVFPPHAEPGGDCVLARLLEAFPEQGRHDWPAGFEGGIAHRLDTATSGLLLVACDPAALERLRAQFRARRLRKHYLLVTARRVPWRRHRVEARLAHDRRRRARMVVERGRATPHRGRWLEAATEFELVGPLAGGLWLWRARIESGVMHQVRVHAAFAGIALAGDRLYGGGPLDLPRPEGAPFLLHHERVEGPGWATPALPPPDSWPARRRR